MKRFAIALSVMAVLGLSACTHGGTWTPQGEGRTAGMSDAAPMKHRADKTFNKAMHK